MNIIANQCKTISPNEINKSVGNYENLGESSNARPLKSEEFSHFSGQMGEAIAPLDPGSDGSALVQVLSSRAFGR